MSPETKAATSLVLRSGWNHIRYIKPAAAIEPSMYPGKVESTVMTMLLDILGAEPKNIINKTAALRFCSAFNLIWRTYDEVLDEERCTTETVVTGRDLENIAVCHKYAGKIVTGAEGVQIALDSLYEAIPGNDPQSRMRRDRIEGLLASYRERLLDTVNDPKYHEGEVLPFRLANESKTAITGFLGEAGAGMCALLLDLPDDSSAIELFRGASVAMQFGDDFLDWKKDWDNHNKRRLTTDKRLRPIENLLLSTLEENQGEKVSCESCVNDETRRGALWIKELAPNTLDLFQHRFQSELDRLPPHPHRETVKGIISLTFYKLLPHAPGPEDKGFSGWFYRWAKY